MRKLIGFLSLLFIICIQVSNAQTRTLTGVVTDKNDGLPLPGVSIMIKGTHLGTATDAQGKYMLDVKSSDILEFSFVGMKSQTIPVGDRTLLNVAMENDAQNLEEVVVTGYGVNRRCRRHQP